MGVMFGIFPTMFFLIFFAVIAIFVVTLLKGVSQWNRNNHQPVLSVPAEIVAKREDVRRHHSSNSMHSHTSTTYYVTFEVESGDRLELCVNGNDYGFMVEGDFGKLTFQGTRFLGFERG